MISNIENKAEIPPARLNAIEIILPVNKADKKHLDIKTSKQSLTLKTFLLVSINNVTMLASPIFAPGQKGNAGIRSSTVNKPHAIIRFVFFNLPPHQFAQNPK